MDEVAVIVTTSHGLWAAWHREQDGFLTLPPEAFGALCLPWGSPLKRMYRRNRVRAKLVVISKPLRHTTSLYDVPLVAGALYVATDGYGAIIDVHTDDDKQLSSNEYGVADSASVITVREDRSCIGSDIPASLLELDDQLSELSDSSTDADRLALLKLSRADFNVLVTGPASVGKSFALRELSRRSRLSYIFICGTNIKQVFDINKYTNNASPPYVAVLDDLDEIDMSESMPCLESIFSNSMIISVIAITSSLQSLPLFFRKRFRRTVEIGIPSFNQRHKILHEKFKDNQAHSDLDLFVASLTPGYTRSGLSSLCLRARATADILGESLNCSHFEKILGTRRKPLRKFAGYESAVRRLNAIKHQWKLQAYSKDVLVSGVLLHGPSGCGKTLMIQCELQQDISLNCIILNAASIYSKYLGESEARVRNVFLEARRRKPCIVFIDDIDGISGSRNSDDNGDSGVKNRVLSTLLNELDGVSGRDGVYIVAATNRIDRVDGAMLRPGRFDVHVNIGRPTYSDRIAIIKSFAQSMAIDHDVNLEEIVAGNMTGADIHTICQRAGLIALSRHRNATSITAEDFHLALEEWKAFIPS